jgi:two-component system, NtrC family, sensor kinase
VEGLSTTKIFIQKIEKQFPALPVESSDTITEALDAADWEYISREFPMALNQSKEGLERISSIIRAMKVFAHPNSKEMVPGDLNELMQTTMTISSNEWQYIATIETAFAFDLPRVPMFADEMSQVLLSILVNAAYAIRERYQGEPKSGLIRISTRQEKEHVELRLTDNGTGMSSEVQRRMFDPFFSTKEVGQGSGQGMTISYDVVVNKHNGTLECESREGEGTTIILRIPMEKMGDKKLLSKEP